MAVLIGILLVCAWSAEALGSIAAITGAYLLGITASHAALVLLPHHA